MEGMMGHHIGTQAAAETIGAQSASMARPALVETQENPSVLRLTAALLVGSVSFVCATFLVVCVRKSVRGFHGTSKFDRIHSCTMCFASGVFLATVFLALFPDLQRRVEVLRRSWSVSHGEPYPLSELLLLAALFANWMIDRFLAAACLAGRDWLRTLRRLRMRHHTRSGRTRITQAQAQPFLSECDSSEELARDTEYGVAETECELHSKQLLPENEEYVTQPFEQDGVTKPVETVNNRLTRAQHRASDAEQEHSQARTRVVRFVLLFTAMCAHATLEGGALSTLSDGASVAMLSVAMLAHSFVCACAVALAALGTFASRAPHRAIACALSCAAAFCFLPFVVVAFVQLVTPAMPMHTATNATLHNQTTLNNRTNTQTDKETPSVAAVGFESFAIGSFLYVVFICWLPAELNGLDGARTLPRSCHAETIQTETDAAAVSTKRYSESALEYDTQLRSAGVDNPGSSTNKAVTDVDQAQMSGESNGKTQRSDGNTRRISGVHGRPESQPVPVDDAAFRSVKDELLKLTLCFAGALLVALLRLVGPHH